MNINEAIIAKAISHLVTTNYRDLELKHFKSSYDKEEIMGCVVERFYLSISNSTIKNGNKNLINSLLIFSNNIIKIVFSNQAIIKNQLCDINLISYLDSIQLLLSNYLISKSPKIILYKNTLMPSRILINSILSILKETIYSYLILNSKVSVEIIQNNFNKIIS